MKKTIIILALAFGTSTLNAQDISRADMEKKNPQSAEVASDIDQYIETDQEFVEVYNWLIETPIHQEDEKRQMANASIASYIEKNPNFNIELDNNLLKFAETSPELLPVFMGGYTVYIIENGKNDPVQANIAGVQSLIDYYKKNEMFLEEDKNIKKLIRKAEKDKLEKYVERKSN